jgi:hypothetical protein
MGDQFSSIVERLFATPQLDTEFLISCDELAGRIDQCAIEIENECVEDAMTHAGLLARIM